MPLGSRSGPCSAALGGPGVSPRSPARPLRGLFAECAFLPAASPLQNGGSICARE